MQGKRFRYLYSRMGLKPADVAKLLHVSERTIHNWVAGSVRVPYSAYKLLKIQLHYELPGKAWEGWSFAAGKLYTPEGYSLHPHDWSWWSLLARRAAMFGHLARENGLLKAKIERDAAAARQAVADAQPLRPAQVVPLAAWRQSAWSPMVITGITQGVPHSEMPRVKQ
jgi:hypothetical protein